MAARTSSEQRASAPKVVRLLAKRYTQKPDMDLGSPKDTLLGVLLSARTRDAQVLKIFPAFKARFPTFKSLAASTPAQIGTSISTIGLYRAKAKAIHALSNQIIERFNGKVPSKFEDLVSLPGIGRKTANCILNYVFGEPAVCVDTHVFRISRRLGWTSGKTPEAVERDLRALLPKTLWAESNRVFVRFGRDICIPGKPKCWQCPVAKWCAYTPKTVPSFELRVTRKTRNS